MLPKFKERSGPFFLINSELHIQYYFVKDTEININILCNKCVINKLQIVLLSNESACLSWKTNSLVMPECEKASPA